MNFKKIGVIAVSLILVFGTVGCSKSIKQGEEKKETRKEMVLEEEQEEVKEDLKEQNKSLLNQKVVEKFPELKNIKEYLYTNYPLTEGMEEKKKEGFIGDIPISLYYNSKDKKDAMIVTLSFEESVTKKQMVEAIDYVARKLDEMLPEKTRVIVETRVSYTDDGVFMKDIAKERDKIEVAFTVNDSEDVRWSIIGETGSLESFNPAEVLELTVERAREYLKKAGVEEESFKNNEYSGADESGTYGYMIGVKEDKETIQNVIYTVEIGTDLTEEEYVENVIEYFKTAAVFPYKGGDTKALTKFIEDNVAELVGVYREAETIEGIEGLLMMGKATKKTTIGKFSVVLKLDIGIMLMIIPIEEEN